MEFPHPITLEIIEDIVDQCGDELDLQFSELLGCGDYGCAFKTDQDTVVKITKHKKEADATHYILNNKLKHPSLPEIYDIWVWEACHSYDDPVYVIHREELDELPVNELWFESVIGILEIELYRLKFQKSLTEDGIYETLADLMEQTPGTLEEELIAEKIGDLYAWAIKNNIWIDDVLASNFGIRGETPVIRDLGAIKISIENKYRRNISELV